MKQFVTAGRSFTYLVDWFPRPRFARRTHLSLAQSPAKVYRIAVLAVAAPSDTWRTFPAYQAFLEGLREVGYVEGENPAIKFRSAESNFCRLPYLTADLVALKPEVFRVGTRGAPLERVTH